MTQWVRALATKLTVWPVFHPWDPHKGGRLSLLTYTHALWHICALPQIQKYKKAAEYKTHASNAIFWPFQLTGGQGKQWKLLYYSIREGSTERRSRTCAGPPNYRSWWWRHDLIHWGKTARMQFSDPLLRTEDKIDWGHREETVKSSKRLREKSKQYL